MAIEIQLKSYMIHTSNLYSKNLIVLSNTHHFNINRLNLPEYMNQKNIQ